MQSIRENVQDRLQLFAQEKAARWAVLAILIAYFLVALALAP